MLLEVARSGEAAWEADRGRVAAACLAVDVRSAGIGQAEQPSDLVERLAGRVVDGGAEHRDVVGDVVDEQDLGVAAADEQRTHSLIEASVLQLVDGDVRDEVVDAVERLVVGQRERLGRRDAHEQCASEPGPAGDRDRVDVLHPQAGLRVGLLQGRDHRLEMGPAGDLRHDAPEPGVLVDAGRDRVGQQLGAPDDAHTGLVARRLDAEDEGLTHPAILTERCGRVAG